METFEHKSAAADAFLAAVARSPQRTLIALDFDGTLSDTVADPNRAYIHPDARASLGRIIQKVGHVAIITGRPVDQVQELACLDQTLLAKLVILGQYGAERLDAEGRHVPEYPQSVRSALEELAPLAQRHPGLYLEDKRHAVAVHTRRAGAGTLQDIESDVVEVARRHDLDIEPGKQVLELRAHRVSKGDALRALVKETNAEIIAMVGDDLGDVPAFDVVQEWQALGRAGVVVVSSSDERPELVSRADVLCDGPAGVAVWLDTVLGEKPLH